MNNVFLSPTLSSSLEEWLFYIENLHYKSIDLNLDRIKKIAVKLELLHPATYVILVGGTNGKGTTCCLLESIFLFNNIRVGLYTSPHLLSYKERIRIFGKELSDFVHIESMYMIEQVRAGVSLTYFEFITLVALYIFKKEKLDIVILEVGLGGRLDATNVVDADISVITNIEVDHVNFLGKTRISIAKEKFGIFRFNRPAIVGEINYSNSMHKLASCYGAILFIRNRDWGFHIFKDKWIWWSYNDKKILSFLPFPIIPIENAAIALSVLSWVPFKISEVSIHYSLLHASLPGRFQIITYYPLLILDVAHNPHSVGYLIRCISSMIKKNTVVRAVVGMLNTKDIYASLYYFRFLVRFWYCASLNTALSATSTQLANCLVGSNIKKFDNIVSAWIQAMSESSCEDCVVVFGSFYSVSPIFQKIIKK